MYSLRSGTEGRGNKWVVGKRLESKQAGAPICGGRVENTSKMNLLHQPSAVSSSSTSVASSNLN